MMSNEVLMKHHILPSNSAKEDLITQLLYVKYLKYSCTQLIPQSSQSAQTLDYVTLDNIIYITLHYNGILQLVLYPCVH